MNDPRAGEINEPRSGFPSRQRMPQDTYGGNGDDDIKTEIPMQKILAGAALKAACQGV
ncbi:hypothetical protein [Rhizobium leguminosarum]|uniref:hypothetical protein n=1 Tax=Rhizobium leguminosarum TaxID=384 RepID=UPI001C93DD3A|nr:hypothetical protein [Rhizobium leguminosarum]MBY5519606.1 hypothetical protein [Rhizobium leguminosarum]